MHKILRLLQVIFCLLCLQIPMDLEAQIKTPENEFTFAIIGDSQFNEPEKFNRLVEQVAMLHPSLIIQVGDLISGKVKDQEENRLQWERFRGQIEPFEGIPYFPVPGNHDVLDKDGKPSAEKFFQQQWGALYYSFDYRNAHFVILNSNDSVEARIGPLQTNWLIHDLKKNQNKEHIFVFFHHPIYFLKNEGELHKIFLQYGVKKVFYGHLHHYEYQEKDGISYIMTNATGKTAINIPEAGNFNHFLMATVKDDEFSFAIIPLGGVISPYKIAPEDNRLYFLKRFIFPENPLPSGKITLNAEGLYEFPLILNNPTDQDLTAFIQWETENGRWEILPGTGKEIRLEAREIDHHIPFQFKRTDKSVIETWPRCRVSIKFLTSSGKWIENEYVLEIK